MSIHFAEPWALVALILLPIFYRVGWPRLQRLPLWLRRLAMGFRLVITTLLVLALAQPSIGRANDTVSVVFAVDRSASNSIAMHARTRSFVEESLALTDERHRAAVVAFGSDSVVERTFDGSRMAESTPGTIGTNIADALRLSRSLMPHFGGKRIILLSDGQENLGRAEEEARLAAHSGVQIDVVPLGADERPEVLLTALDVAPQVREGEPVDLRIAVQSTVATTGVLRLWLNQQLISEEAVQLQPGSNTFSATRTGLDKGFHSFWARVESPTDTFGENNELGAFTVVKDQSRVLVIATTEAEGTRLRDELANQGMDVELRPPTFIPPSLAAMRRYDAVVLVNVPATAMTIDQMRTLKSYVQTLGGGLTVVGGEQAYSVGEYMHTPIDEVLPVAMRMPGRRDTGSVAVVMVIDKSGSMGVRERDDATKMVMAREAAVQSIDTMRPEDYIGVVAFDHRAELAVQVRQIGSSADAIKRQVQMVRESGGTQILPGLELGYQAIRDVPAQQKHIILLSDGLPNSPEDYGPILQRLNADFITLSTIGIGSDADPGLLQELARIGEGRYHYVERAAEVPQVTVQETRLASGSPIVEGPVSPSFTSPSPIIRNIAEAKLPQITGYNVTTPKDTAQVVMVTDQERPDPLLAQWQFGLGRSVAWTTDVKETWSAAWLAWEDYGRFWSQLVRWTMPAPTDQNLQTIASVRESSVVVQVEALDDGGRFRDHLDLRMTVQGADSNRIEQAVRQVAPGRYEAAFPVPEVGVYSVDVAQLQSGQVTLTESTGFAVPYPSEYRFLGSDDSTLHRVAALSDGRVLRDPRAVFRPDGLTFEGKEWFPLWPWLLGIALALFPFDVATRRLNLPAGLIDRLFRTRPA